MNQRSRIPRGLARRLDRLARRAHAFHRYAHHPLCDEYASEVVGFGRRVRICRGCALTAAGALAGGLSALAAPGSLALSVFLVPPAIALAMVRSRRLGKFVRRCLPAFGLAFAALSSLRAGGGFGIGLAAAVFAGVFLFARSYRARQPDRRPCEICPERAGPVPCRGVAPIVRRERAVRRLAGRWLEARAPLVR
jgi:hypothetical protein